MSNLPHLTHEEIDRMRKPALVERLEAHGIYDHEDTLTNNNKRKQKLKELNPEGDDVDMGSEDGEIRDDGEYGHYGDYDGFYPQSPMASPTPSESQFDATGENSRRSSGPPPSPNFEPSAPPFDPHSSAAYVGSKNDSAVPQYNPAVGENIVIHRNPNIFAHYQEQVQQVIREIEQIGSRGVSSETAMRQYIQSHMHKLYALFFGHAPVGLDTSHSTTEEDQLSSTHDVISYKINQNLVTYGIESGFAPTKFYIRFGAAPICGLNPAQLYVQTTKAQAVQKASQKFSRITLGTLIDMLASLRYQERENPFTHIAALKDAVINLQKAAKHLLETDPLFIVSRNINAQQGGLRVRGFLAGAFYSMKKMGAQGLWGFLNRVSGIPESLRENYQNILSVAFRDLEYAIERFEDALKRYDNVYQNLPIEFGLCWTLKRPNDGGSIDPNTGIFPSKPMGELARQAVANNNPSDMVTARESVLTTPIECYPAFLTMDSEGRPYGALLAYYTSLWGGRKLYEMEGEEAFNTLKAKDLQGFNRVAQPLINSLLNMVQLTNRNKSFFEGPSGARALDIARRITNRDPSVTPQEIKQLEQFYAYKVRSEYRPIGTDGTGSLIDPNRHLLTTKKMLQKEYANLALFQDEVRAIREQEVINKRQEEIRLKNQADKMKYKEKEFAEKFIPEARQAVFSLLTDLQNQDRNLRSGPIGIAQGLRTLLQLRYHGLQQQDHGLQQQDHGLQQEDHGLQMIDIVIGLWFVLTKFNLLSIMREISPGGAQSVIASTSESKKIAAVQLLLSRNADGAKFALALVGQVLKRYRFVANGLTFGGRTLSQSEINHMVSLIESNPYWNSLINFEFRLDGNPRQRSLAQHVLLIVEASPQQSSQQASSAAQKSTAGRGPFATGSAATLMGGRKRKRSRKRKYVRKTKKIRKGKKKHHKRKTRMKNKKLHKRKMKKRKMTKKK